MFHSRYDWESGDSNAEFVIKKENVKVEDVDEVQSSLDESSTSSDESSNEEGYSDEKVAPKCPVIRKERIRSPHDVTSYTSFSLSENSVSVINDVLTAKVYDVEEVSTTVPWHVNKNCVILIDLEKLKSRDDITVDSWTWRNSKTYIVSSIKECGYYSVGDVKDHTVSSNEFTSAKTHIVMVWRNEYTQSIYQIK